MRADKCYLFEDFKSQEPNLTKPKDEPISIIDCYRRIGVPDNVFKCLVDQKPTNQQEPTKQQQQKQQQKLTAVT